MDGKLHPILGKAIHLEDMVVSHSDIRSSPPNFGSGSLDLDPNVYHETRSVSTTPDEGTPQPTSPGALAQTRNTDITGSEFLSDEVSYIMYE